MDQLRKHPAQTPDAAFLEAVDVGLTDAHGISGLRGGLLRQVDRADDILLFGRESLHCHVDCRMQRFTVGTFESHIGNGLRKEDLLFLPILEKNLLLFAFRKFSMRPRMRWMAYREKATPVEGS